MDRRLIILLLILLLPTVTAFKVGPAAQSFTLEPGTVSEYGLRVFNDGRETFTVSVSTEGTFADYVTLEPATFTMGPSDAERRVLVTITHPPEDLLVPGKNTVKIRVSAKPQGDTQFSSTVSLNHNLNVYRRYEGTFIEGSLFVEDAPAKGDTAVFTLSLANRGSEEGTVTGTTVLLDAHESLVTLPLGTTSLAADAEGKLTKRWRATLEPGRYDTRTSYEYDDGGVETKKVLDGSMTIGLPSVTFAPVRTTLQSENIENLDLAATLSWNKPVEAEATVTLLKDDEVIVQMVTPRTTLTPGTATAFSAFLEVPAIEAGDYMLRVTARTPEGVLGEKLFPVSVITQGIVPTFDEPSSFTIPLLILLIIILITFGLWWFKKKR